MTDLNTRTHIRNQYSRNEVKNNFLTSRSPFHDINCYEAEPQKRSYDDVAEDDEEDDESEVAMKRSKIAGLFEDAAESDDAGTGGDESDEEQDPEYLAEVEV